MDEPSTSTDSPQRRRFQRLGALGKQTIPFVMGVAAALVALLLFRLLYPPAASLTTRDVNATIMEAMASATPPPAFSERVYQAILPSLVFIQTEGNGEGSSDAKSKREYGVGSGVVVDDAGDILTAMHVVTNTDFITVTFADGTESGAQVIVKQPENDIAVIHPIKLPAQVVPAVMGNPNAVRIGDEAYVVGNPLGLYGSMSAGVISGLGRSFAPQHSGHKLKDLIQIDAAVNPGNSGGPLLNRYGQVIGIVTALANPTEQDVFIGIGFAVPINVAGAAAGLPPD